MSGDHPDHFPERLVEVAVAFIDSVGRPGWGRRMVQRRALALGALARSITATAAAIHEPGVSEVLNNEEGARLRNALARMAEMANDGMLAEAARTFVTVVATNRELAAAASAGYETAWGALRAHRPAEFQQTHLDPSDAPRPTDPAVLTQISVLLLHGSDKSFNGRPKGGG